MTDQVFAEVDSYLDGLFGPPDPVLEEALERAAAAGLPAISVSPVIGRFLHVLAISCGARRILELGTLAGYSAIWLARALPENGQLISLEFQPKHAEVARRNIEAAGLSDRVEIQVGPAIDLLAQLEQRDAEPFDFVFIDADKAPYLEYFEASLRLSRPGTLIVADNVVRRGEVAKGPSDNEDAAGIQRFNAAIARDPRVHASFIQTVGAKSHDGMAIAVVR